MQSTAHATRTTSVPGKNACSPANGAGMPQQNTVTSRLYRNLRSARLYYYCGYKRIRIL
jgi:hypothetical protein